MREGLPDGGLMVCPPSWEQWRLIMNAQERSETPTIIRDGRFYAGMAALVLMVLVMPLSAVVVPLLGLPTAQATTLFAVLAGFPDPRVDRGRRRRGNLVEQLVREVRVSLRKR